VIEERRYYLAMVVPRVLWRDVAFPGSFLDLQLRSSSTLIQTSSVFQRKPSETHLPFPNNDVEGFKYQHVLRPSSVYLVSRRIYPSYRPSNPCLNAQYLPLISAEFMSLGNDANHDGLIKSQVPVLVPVF
jgi:hypothetical protein